MSETNNPKTCKCEQKFKPSSLRKDGAAKKALADLDTRVTELRAQLYITADVYGLSHKNQIDIEFHLHRLSKLMYSLKKQQDQRDEKATVKPELQQRMENIGNKKAGLCCCGRKSPIAKISRADYDRREKARRLSELTRIADSLERFADKAGAPPSIIGRP